jgi:TatD DNase family protein
MNIFETHAHLDFPDFNADRDKLIKKCFQSGINYIINVGIDQKTSEASIRLAEKYDNIYATTAYHPHEASHYKRDVIYQLAKHPKVVAIGETGLDFFRNRSPREVQIQAFEDQIQLANELNLPLVVHDREAHKECMDILVANKPSRVVFHCFSGSPAFAEEVFSQGWNISFTGNITYKKSPLQDVVRIAPLNKIFIETDSPFLAPHPQRGKRNSPLNLRYLIEKISELKGISPKEVAESVYRNSIEFFLDKLD